MNKVMHITYFHVTACVPFICRMLLQTISEDICVHIATYLPKCDGSKLLSVYILYNELKFNQLSYIKPLWIHLLRRKIKPYSKRESSCTDIIRTGRVVVPSTPESRYELSSHKKHFSTRTKCSQKKSKRRVNKLWTKSRQSSRTEKYSIPVSCPCDDDYESDYGYESDFYSY